MQVLFFIILVPINSLKKIVFLVVQRVFYHPPPPLSGLTNTVFLLFLPDVFFPSFFFWISHCTKFEAGDGVAKVEGSSLLLKNVPVISVVNIVPSILNVFPCLIWKASLNIYDKILYFRIFFFPFPPPFFVKSFPNRLGIRNFIQPLFF